MIQQGFRSERNFQRYINQLQKGKVVIRGSFLNTMEGALQECWPELVVPVQSLSNTGMTVIPERYVKPPADRPTFTPVPPDHAPGAVSVPIIDLHGLIEGSAFEARLQTAKAISDACKEWGFFQVVNHGVSPDLLKKIKSVWRDFFWLPMEEKKAYANSPKTYEGYGSRLGVAKDAVLDWSDYYFLNLAPESTKSAGKWPVRPSSLRKVTEEYSGEVMKLCGMLMKALSLSLGLHEGYLRKAFGGDEDIGACMRANLYPKCPQPGLTLGLSPHSDPGGLTVLLADDEVEGLQVRRGDAWVCVRPQPNAFIINMGDQIQIISNGIYKSVEHRVTVSSEMERFSIAFFYNPGGHLPIAPARELLSPENPPLYPSTTFNEYRMGIRMKGPCGKSQLESLYATAAAN